MSVDDKVESFRVPEIAVPRIGPEPPVKIERLAHHHKCAHFDVPSPGVDIATNGIVMGLVEKQIVY